MARYYDMDKLAEMLEAKANTMIEGGQIFHYVAKWLKFVPPVDVAPIAETVREMQERLKEKAYTNNYCQEIVLKEDIDKVAEEMLKGEEQ